MDLKQKITILGSHPLFNSLPQSILIGLVEKTRQKTFAPKTTILDQANPAEAIYFIYQGLIKIYVLNEEGRVLPIRVKGPPYIVGELNLFDNKSSANVEAILETKTLIFSKIDFVELVHSQPNFAFKLLKIITEKLRAANDQANYQFSADLKHRIQKILQTLAPYFPNQKITLSQEELSFMVGASRARVSEVLNQLKVEKLVTITRKNIHLC